MVKKQTQIRKIITDYKSVLEKNNIKPLQIVLYGSYNNGKPNSWSDIDLAIIAKSFGKRNPIERMEFLAQKAAEVDDSLEVLGFTQDEYQKEKDGIFGQVISRGRSFQFNR